MLVVSAAPVVGPVTAVTIGTVVRCPSVIHVHAAGVHLPVD
jgi:hypothetical protein